MKYPEPRIDEQGVPRCAPDNCGAYDGKRCDLLGYRPDSVCEPAVRLLVKGREWCRACALIASGMTVGCLRHPQPLYGVGEGAR